MTLIEWVILALVIGALVWAARTYLPIDAVFINLITFVAIVILLLLLLSVFGVVTVPSGRLA